jgi:hypothetical protein
MSGAVTEIARVLKPEGVLLAREPVKGAIIPSRRALGPHADHPTNENVYTIRKWKKFMKRGGLQVETFYTEHPFHPLFGSRRTIGSESRPFSYASAFILCRKKNGSA